MNDQPGLLALGLLSESEESESSAGGKSTFKVLYHLAIEKNNGDE